MKSLYISLIILLSLQGCSTKEVQLNTNEPSTQKQIDTKENASDVNGFEGEFENESQTCSDPFSGYNTLMTSFNDGIITYALNPLSEAYAYVIPQPLRIGISNAIHNIQFPIRFANNLLQGKFQNASDELGRFFINSTFGLAGFMDPAKEYKGLLPHNEDFGQTLGYYGVKSGYPIVLPFLGPSNIRDMVGISVDAYASPLVHVGGLDNYKIPQNFVQTAAIYTGVSINKTSLQLGQYESIKKDALELYPFLRDVYEQKRVSEIEE